jgi:DNA polymerase-3 subunit alpha
LESLVYAGAFDEFSQLHRAQYLNIPEGESQTGLEKMIRYGNVVQAEATNTTNTLFGDLPAVLDIKPPQIAPCSQFSLTEKLEKEKEVTGIYLSGHPLDHYKFEIKHYGITSVTDFNDIKESALLAGQGKTYKLLGLVTLVNHRISQKGNKFGSFTIEDYSGKTELVLFGDDYAKYQHFFMQGQAIYITGGFKQRWNKAEFEFKLTAITLAENVKRAFTKQLCLEVDVRNVQPDLIEFLEENLKAYPGPSSVRISITEPKEDLKATLQTNGKGFEMNEAMIRFLEKTPEVEVKVATL